MSQSCTAPPRAPALLARVPAARNRAGAGSGLRPFRRVRAAARRTAPSTRPPTQLDEVARARPRCARMRRRQADERRQRVGGDAHALGRGPPRQVQRHGERLRNAPAQFIQLSDADADDVLDKPFWKEDPAARDVVMTTAAGIHMAPISQVRPSLALCASIR
jgi:hypothetical protein